MTTQAIDIANISSADLERLLEKKKKQEQEERRKKRLEYEQERDQMVKTLVHAAISLHENMKAFKLEAMTRLEDFTAKANLYGDIKKHSKGGFSLRTTDSEMMVSYDRNTQPEYDERAQLAEELLKQFLEDMIKKRDVKMFRTITALMSRNKEGQYYPSRINALLKIKDNYDDVRWLKAMELFEESYRNRLVSYTVTFYQKGNDGKDKNIPLTFASLPVVKVE
jgi:hypothetical protein